MLHPPISDSQEISTIDENARRTETFIESPKAEITDAYEGQVK
jgi:hypothetical protein